MWVREQEGLESKTKEFAWRQIWVPANSDCSEPRIRAQEFLNFNLNLICSNCILVVIVVLGEDKSAYFCNSSDVVLNLAIASYTLAVGTLESKLII